ncbi:MAG: ribosome maturation factor RimP [Clostridiales bacterium]|nr:ribosome maturation factor RimP [Clostridiales bacterium]
MAKKGGSKKGAGSGNTAAVCYRLAESVAAELGFMLWDVRFVREGPTWYLRIYIDKEDGGVSIDDCVAMSHRMDKLLDEKDPIPQAYCLEVCSPGIERELTRPEHFERFMGWPVVVRLFHSAEGDREIAGILSGFDDNEIAVITEEEKELRFTRKETSSVRLLEDWDEDDYGGDSENE